MNKEKIIFTIREASKHFDIPENIIRSAVKDDKIKKFSYNSTRVYITKNELENFIKNYTA
jgi:hypothetical protein